MRRNSRWSIRPPGGDPHINRTTSGGSLSRASLEGAGEGGSPYAKEIIKIIDLDELMKFGGEGNRNVKKWDTMDENFSNGSIETVKEKLSGWRGVIGDGGVRNYFLFF